MLNKIAKVQIKILIIVLIVSIFVIIPKVMAMSFDQALAYRPYGIFALFALFAQHYVGSYLECMSIESAGNR